MPHYGESNTDNESEVQYRGAMSIPTRCIESVRKIKYE